MPCSLKSWRKSCANTGDLIGRVSVPWVGSKRVLIWVGLHLLRVPNFMNDKCFVDTNILMYAHDRASGVKNLRARSLIEELWKSGGGVLSTQVLQELCINVRRKSIHPLSLEETRKLIEDYSSWTVVINTAESVLEALDVESRYNISFWDALIIQAAGSSGATVLYSEDLADGQNYGAVRVVNPLHGMSSESSE